MEVLKTEFPGLCLIKPKIFNDERGFFYESYHFDKFKLQGIDIVFKQDNHSRSERGTIRGLHFQKGSAAQTKLVRCVVGEIYDVVVDLRRNSPTFGRWAGYKLSAENKQQLLVPQGFAHGFSVLSEHAEFLYKCDNYYSPQDERGIIWNDAGLAIDWLVKDPIISAKDNKLPLFKELPADDLY